MRRAHYLKGDTKGSLPLHVVFLDTEALNEAGEIGPGKQRLWSGTAIYNRFEARGDDTPRVEERLLFTEAAKLWEWVTSFAAKGRTLWVLAHNWNYDAPILNTGTWFASSGWECTGYINERPPVIVRFRRDTQRICLVDNLNYFSSSLAELGDSIGLPKYDMPSSSCSSSDWERYQWRDVEIVQRSFLAFRRYVLENDLGTFQRTLASQAMTAYRHRWLDRRILIHDNPEACALERESYHGGRVENYWYGMVERELTKLDVNSLYPSVMRVEDVPVRLYRYYRRFNPVIWSRHQSQRGLIARCSISTDEPAYPYRSAGRLIFPVGEFETVLTDPEIRYAEARGHIKEVLDFAAYDTAQIFAPYVDYFYSQRLKFREAGNEAFSYVSKLMMNGLYGRFGMSGIRWEDSRLDLEPDDRPLLYRPGPDEPVTEYRRRLGKLQYKSRENETDNSFPGIAATIAGAARLCLWELVCKAGEREVFYVDTDSLVVTTLGAERLGKDISTLQLGALKVEGVSHSSAFWTSKDYAFDNVAYIKGVRKKARQISPTRYIQERFTSWDANIEKGVDGYVTVEEQVKTLTRHNKKRLVTGVGWTEPIRVML